MVFFPFPLLTACKERKAKTGKEIVVLERRTETVNPLPQLGTAVLLGVGTVGRSPEENSRLCSLFSRPPVGRWDSPSLEVQKLVVAPAGRAACIGEAPVRPCKWKMLLDEHIWERRDQACLFTENLWLSRAAWSGSWCPLQSPAHSQQTTEPCQNLLQSLDFELWLTTEFHSLELGWGVDGFCLIGLGFFLLQVLSALLWSS